MAKESNKNKSLTTKSQKSQKKGSLYKKKDVSKEIRKPLRKVKKGIHNESDDDEEDEEEEAADIDLSKKNSDNIQNFTFEFSDISVKHSNSLSTLMRPLISNSTAGYELVDIICLQEEVGTVVNCENDDDLFAMATSIEISSIEKTQYYNHLLKILKGLENHPSLSKTKSFKEINSLFNSESSTSSIKRENTSFYFYSRFLNLPLILTYELQRNLHEDLKWIKDKNNQKDIDEKVFNTFSKLENLLLVRPLDTSLNGLNNEEVFNSNNILTHFFEDDVFLSHASHAFVTSATSPLVGNQLLFMIVPYKNLDKILEDIKNLVE